MRVTIALVFEVDDDTTDEALDNIAANALVQVEEPIAGLDDDGNEIDLPGGTRGATYTVVREPDSGVGLVAGRVSCPICPDGDRVVDGNVFCPWRD